MNTVTEYIRRNIGLAVCNNIEDTPERFGLPHPYSVPTVGEFFRALFYWDTYFTNLGLLELGDLVQARHNTENFAALIERLGYIPNGNTPALCDRSQPPFFSLMIRDVYARSKDAAWLSRMYPALCTEHAFWMRERNTDQGLAHYGSPVPADREESYARAFAGRIGMEYTRETQTMLASNFIAQAESGWDFNARFELDSLNYCPVDLNSLLWAMEDNLATFASILENGDETHWRTLADQRASRMRAFLKHESGAFFDRNAVTGSFSPYFSAASLYPLFVGMATQQEAEATCALLPRLMHTWGVAPCQEIDGGRSFQWGSPNGWPCLQVVSAVGLRRYGLVKEAEKIEQGYTTMVERVFADTGALWEKYNLDTGSNDAVNEYEMPEMLGWTAGAYLYFKNLPQKHS